MTFFFNSLLHFISRVAPYLVLLVAALSFSLLLTPVVRGFARRIGMVDMPSARRINRTPIPRGGGIAVYLSVCLSLCLGWLLFGDVLRDPEALAPVSLFRVMALSGAICLVGFLDDRYSMPPLVKLVCQIAVALGAHFWAGAGFSALFPSIPAALDCAVSTFWIVGAMNAFNLIDGLDGLATGLACIAAFGMAGALFFVGQVEASLAFFAFVGACLGFLRYNFSPASVFLGDAGSMFLGFFLSVLALLANTSHSFLVGVGVPILAMGVPIFDTALAIVRRLIRAVLKREAAGDVGSSRVMQADTDHIHHRILRHLMSQRKAAFALYGAAAFLVLIGLGGIALRGRAVSLYIVGFMVAVTIIFRDMRRIELWDMGRLLNVVARDSSVSTRRRFHVLKVPLLLFFDCAVLFGAWLVSSLLMSETVAEASMRRWMPLYVVSVFLSLVAFRAYVTVWSRAMLSNYARLAAGIVFGVGVAVALAKALDLEHLHIFAFSVVFASVSFLGFALVRTVRPLLRDLFYSVDCGRLLDSSDAKRIVVYGAGLRYVAFRRELVRSTSRNTRVIVGIIDDDILLRGQYVGGIRVCGTLEQSASILKSLKADAVVIACQLTPARLGVAKKMFAACGVPVTMWHCEEVSL